MELAHPADFFAPEPRTSSEWTIDAHGMHAEVHWGGRGDRIDPLTQVTNEHMTITATASDGTIRTVSDVVPNRFWTLTEFTAAVELGNRPAQGCRRHFRALRAGGDVRRLRRDNGPGRADGLAHDHHPRRA